MKKAIYLKEYENKRGTMSLSEIKAFLSVKASFVSTERAHTLISGKKCPWVQIATT